ncbi:SANT/Myb_domain [Hexamita inflata]|uniref:SANT/Myb domain n=1 Tax=Hexamita inflata TaxID=28002 RepID=A0AA86P0J7_9EUKA|nr:SANT/Myb domain [Hexamita inflata]CAI9928795.1 SANT/Myb domain [Hexamita inflata]
MQKKYHGWTEGERAYILNAVRRSGPKINWIQIQKNLPHRTVQQCKSFYNNSVKLYQLERLLPKTSLTSIARMALSHLFIADVTQIRDREKQAYVDQITSDILLNVFLVQAGNFKCGLDLNLIALVREMIIVFNQIKAQMIEEIYVNGHAVFECSCVSQQQLDAVIKLAATYKTDDLFLQLSAVVANGEFQK